ncbi:16S rRNA (cytosine1402-N4)-methyltransferase [Selenomonas ruminantium]|uniref:Ribosomal RNA small subunit methyltransferase H n=2 Tax=Selenomonas ruminantium TaxID=971 RepID=A0A1H0URE0_SELRU|nr:16S rRNA (cytosine(1402)-N(4))-methyltransferase RsmH [Selenomonas ruminantium]SDP68695.1 16S rRNA (cytosine1402-N4)-methyltransferase [Selenomonas ruminantium]
MMEEKQHKRRIHYSGKYPRHFAEKYKELNPEKYGDEVAHVIAKGNTPAGMHIPIMVNEILDVLAIKPGEQGFDGTLGYGGHTLAMLEKLAGQGCLYSGDIDPIESKKTEARIRAKGFGEDIWQLRNMNFCQIDELAREVGGFDFVLADLGVSSMQIDNPERGFTFKSDGPLDLRLNPEAGITAAERLADISKEELEGMLRENADEPYAAEIARQITRRRWPIKTTKELYEEVVKALAKVELPPEVKDKVGYSTKKQALAREELTKKSSARVFQALRIDINHEYEVLYEFMEKLPEALKSGGRVAILTFHSGEDRIVKKAFKAFHQQGIYSDISQDVIRPSKEECYRNSRAHSTKLRWAIKA